MPGAGGTLRGRKGSEAGGAGTRIVREEARVMGARSYRTLNAILKTLTFILQTMGGYQEASMQRNCMIGLVQRIILASWLR